MDRFFTDWFAGLDSGLDGMSAGECSRLFAGCAQRCSRDALRYLYRGLFDECGGDFDRFFSRVGEKSGLDGRVIEPGRVYELIFMSCDCPLHTQAGVNSPMLCECSRQSMICVFSDLVPDRKIDVVRIDTILGGGDCCRFRVSIQ